MADEEEYGGRPRVETGEGSGWKKCLLIFLGVGILLMLIIFPMSFVGVEYYQVRLELCIMICTEAQRSVINYDQRFNKVNLRFYNLSLGRR